MSDVMHHWFPQQKMLIYIDKLLKKHIPNIYLHNKIPDDQTAINFFMNY